MLNRTKCCFFSLATKRGVCFDVRPAFKNQYLGDPSRRPRTYCQCPPDASTFGTIGSVTSKFLYNNFFSAYFPCLYMGLGIAIRSLPLRYRCGGGGGSGTCPVPVKYMSESVWCLWAPLCYWRIEIFSTPGLLYMCGLAVQHLRWYWVSGRERPINLFDSKRWNRFLQFKEPRPLKTTLKPSETVSDG